MVTTMNARMSSEERQRARMELLDAVGKAEAEFEDADQTYENQRRKESECRTLREQKRKVLVKAQEELRGFLGDPDSF